MERGIERRAEKERVMPFETLTLPASTFLPFFLLQDSWQSQRGSEEVKELKGGKKGAKGEVWCLGYS